MSGLEIIGVILGIFPPLCMAGREIAGGCRRFRTWWRFDREFENFLAAVEREHIAFSQNLEIFLAPVENISDGEREALQRGVDPDVWCRPRIQDELRRRIQERYYQWFVRQLLEINGALTELHGMLKPVANVSWLVGHWTGLDPRKRRNRQITDSLRRHSLSFSTPPAWKVKYIASATASSPARTSSSPP
jgi:hypothetical protein